MDPRHAPLLEEAWRLDRAGQQAQALGSYRSFLALEPSSQAAWADLGGLLLVMGQLDEAEVACREALRLDRNHPTAQVNLASTLLAKGQLGPALAVGRQVVAQFPRAVSGRLCLADCLLKSGDLAGARETLEQAMALAPDDHEIHLRLKNLSILEGDWNHLRRNLEWELRHYAGPARDHELAHQCLLFGEMPRGWDLYESRLQVPGLILPERHFLEPRWNGEPFPGRTLLLHWEQGFGDSIMFVRYAAQAKALGGRVHLSVQPELAGLMATCPGVDQVVPH